MTRCGYSAQSQSSLQSNRHETLANAVAKMPREERNASQDTRDRQVWIRRVKRRKASSSLVFAADIQVRRTEQLVRPGSGWILSNRALEPIHSPRKVAGLEMRRAKPHECVESERIVRRQVERDVQPLDP